MLIYEQYINICRQRRDDISRSIRIKITRSFQFVWKPDSPDRKKNQASSRPEASGINSLRRSNGTREFPIPRKRNRSAIISLIEFLVDARDNFQADNKSITRHPE